MKILEFINLCDLADKAEADRAKLLCFYEYKENGRKSFTMSQISDLLVSAGYSKPNSSRLKEKLIKGNQKAFMLVKGEKGTLEFIPAIFQEVEKELGNAWLDYETIESSSEVIDEVKFAGKQWYLDKLIKQINNTYASNCYDACAVLMRRLFEVILVLSYQNLKIDDEIKDKDGTGYLVLDRIVKNAVGNRTLKLSRIKKEFDKFRKVGNFSAHNITYIAGRKDIDDIKLEYRVMLEELYNKAGLI